MPDNRAMRFHGFTLAELLIALVILGIIATFTIPKVLSSQTDTKYAAIGKEVAGMISGAYDSYKRSNQTNAATTALNLTPFMNYVKLEPIALIDDLQTVGTTVDCSSGIGYTCLRLHNGAIVLMNNNVSFGDTARTSAIYFYVDPDGMDTPGSNTGPGRSNVVFLYIGGRLTDFAGIDQDTYNSGFNYDPTPAYVPSWASWN